MATTTLTKSQDKTAGSWSSIFPTEQVTEQQSALFVKKLLAVSVSNITYLRAIFPEHAFGDRCLEDLNLKILRDDSSCPGACQVIKWVKGCFDALDKKYLRTLIIGIYVDPDDAETIIESYTFKFSYTNQGGMDIYRNSTKIASATSAAETKKATIRLLRTIVVLTQTLKSLPDDVFMTMKLLYYESVTPTDYEPPGFKAADSDSFKFEEDPMNIKIGDVSTPWHIIKMRIKTDSKQFELKENPEEEVEQNTDNSRPVGDEAMETDAGSQNIETTEAEQCELVQIDSENKDLEANSMKINEESIVPSESPYQPGPNDQACSNTPVSQRSENDPDEVTVRCACGCNEDDGLMIMCAICKKWQHGVCFLILNEKEAPEWHVCDICAKSLDPDKESTDPYLNELSSIAVQATCLWRRVLVASTEMSRILPHYIAKRLGIEITVAQGLLNRLEKEGLVKQPARGKKLGKLVQIEKIEKEAIPKYFKKKQKTLSTDSEKTSKGHDRLEKDDKINDEVKKLTDKTEEMRISKSKSKGNDTQMSRKSPRIQHNQEKNESSEKQKRGKKRALSKSDETEFDLCDSQDVESVSSISRKKASVVAKAIMV